MNHKIDDYIHSDDDDDDDAAAAADYDDDDVNDYDESWRH